MRAEGAGLILGGLAGLALLVVQGVVFVGLGLPIVKEHCLTGGGPTEPLAVETGWRPAFPLFGAIDSGECVRNTLLREGLAAAGIWELDEPRGQIEPGVTSGVPRDPADYLETMIELRREGEELTEQLVRARPRTLDEWRRMAAEMQTWGEEVMERSAPPILRPSSSATTTTCSAPIRADSTCSPS